MSLLIPHRNNESIQLLAGYHCRRFSSLLPCGPFCARAHPLMNATRGLLLFFFGPGRGQVNKWNAFIIVQISDGYCYDSTVVFMFQIGGKALGWRLNMS